MDGHFSVELADLRGWAGQVGRAGGHCGQLEQYVATCVPDGDFGRILSTIQADYEQFSLQAREVLRLDAARLDDTRAALQHVARGYARTDSRVAQSFGPGAAITDDHSVRGFHDRGMTAPPWPAHCNEVLPQVTFGWAFDQLCRLVQDVLGWDLRRGLTDQIAGDVGKALEQADAWEFAGAAVGVVGDNVSRGARAVTTTWAGKAASSSHDYALEWVGSLDAQSRAMNHVAGHLRDAVTLAVDVAQVIVDFVKEMAYIVMAGWTFASIPIYGQVRAVQGIKDVLRLLWDAKKVLAVFWQALVTLKSCFLGALHDVTGESVPPAPQLPARAA
jgi:hypothetical protein